MIPTLIEIFIPFVIFLFKLGLWVNMIYMKSGGFIVQIGV